MSVHSLHDSVHNAFATILLFRDCFARRFENSCVTKVRTLSRCWVTIISPTGGSQQRFVNGQTKMLPGYPRALFVKPIKGVSGYPGSILVKQSRNKCIIAKALWMESRSEWTDMELQHLFFDSTEELSRQGYFQWIYSLRAAGNSEITVRPCLSFSSGNPQNDNLPKSR